MLIISMLALLLLGSKALKFCIWHRITLYFCALYLILFYIFFSDIVVFIGLIGLIFVLYEFFHHKCFGFSLKEINDEFRNWRN